MPIDTRRARELLQKLDLKRLFVEELNWANPSSSPVNIQHGDHRYRLTPQADGGGMVLFTVDNCPGEGLPDRSTRLAIHKQLLDRAQEHILVFINGARTSTLWMWVDREGGRRKAVYEHRYHVQQPGDSLLQKLAGIAFDWSDLDADGKASIIQVTDRVRANLATERVTKRFYDEFQKQHGSFLKFIKGIEAIRDREWYASIMLNRLMFIYFIQKKGFLGGDTGYLGTRLDECRMLKMPFYDGFLKPLFFRGFACKPEERTEDERKLLGEVPYLNGGLFLKHQIEEANGGIDIPDEAFRAIFEFFDRYQWHLDDRPLRADNEINPDVLGYIFEKYINQKQMGAYYTKEDITEYITKNTVLPFLFDKLRSFCRDAVVPLPVPDVEPYIHDAVKHGVDLPLPPNIAAGLEDVSQRGDWNRRADGDYALPTETWREHIARRKRYQQILDDFAAGKITNINDFITYNLDIIKFTHDFLSDTQDPMVIRAFYFECLRTVTVLDPTCGSGAFLFAALNILEPLYELCLQRMEDFLARKQRHPQWAQPFEAELKRLADHPSRRYFIYKSIIVGNLYGVDIMEEAVEICKLRLFLKLVAQVEEVVDVEPLPDIDFNIRAGNTLVGYATLEEIERAKTQTMDFSGGNIKQRALALSGLLDEFRQAQLRTDSSAQRLGDAKRAIRKQQQALEGELNEDLRAQYGARDLESFVASHRPFHWFVEFTTIVVSGGFDVIVGNPPYKKVGPQDPEKSHCRGYATADSGNLYAPVLERSLALLGKRSRIGMIVPISIASSSDMVCLRAALQSTRNTWWMSHYAIRPQKLFPGVEQRNSIVIGASEGAKWFSTEYRRWYQEERDNLLDRAIFTDVTELSDTEIGVLKVGSDTATVILRRLGASSETLGSVVDARGVAVYYHDTGESYWTKLLPYQPVAYRDGKKVVPSQWFPISVPRASVDIVVLLANSSLCYWLWTSLTDCRHMTQAFLKQLPLPSGVEGAERLAARLIECYTANTTMFEKRPGYVSPEMKVQKAKPIIDEIDRVLGEHYGFTAEELDFIINYDIKYRLGADEGEDG